MKDTETLYDWADERAKHMITEGYVGPNHGNHGINNQILVRFDTSHNDTTPTQTVKIGYYNYCVYCSRLALPIQGGLKNTTRETRRHANYDTTGYMCVCKGAMDEIQLNKDTQEIKNKLEEFKQTCEDEIGNLRSTHTLNNPNTASELVERIIKEKISKIDTIQDLQEFARTLL